MATKKGQNGSAAAVAAAVAQAAKEALAAHEADCAAYRLASAASTAAIRGDIQRLLDAQPRVNDPWREYWRSATIAMVSLVLAAGGALGWNVMQKQELIATGISEISIRGAQNRADITEMKSDLKSTQSKVESIGESVIRLEAMH